MTVFAACMRNVHSQAGEDGVIEAILSRMPSVNGWCVDFGCHDGVTNSNTAALVERGFSAVMIERDEERFAAARANYADAPGVSVLHRAVGFTSEDGLDAVLMEQAPLVPYDFDLVSIDVDGNDIHCWSAIHRYRPKVVCVEFNPTIPTHVRFAQPADHRVSQGSSLLSLVDLGKRKGYELVACTSFNAFFVDWRFFAAMGVADNSPHVLRMDLGAITDLFTGYDGTLFLHGAKTRPWAGPRDIRVGDDVR